MSVITNNPIAEADLNLDVDPEVARLGLRKLVIAGGRPYILITVQDEEGGVEVDHYGVDPNIIPEALYEIAELIQADLDAEDD